MSDGTFSQVDCKSEFFMAVGWKGGFGKVYHFLTRLQKRQVNDVQPFGSH